MEQDLYINLCEKAKGHNKLYHYTSLESLESIVLNKSLRLSSLKNVNDAYENKRVDAIHKDNIFVACFTHRETESNMFWEVYAKEKGVRLEFDSAYFSKCDFDIFTDSNCTSKLRRKKEGLVRKENELLVWNIKFADVEYTRDFDKYRKEDVELKNIFGDDCIMANGQDFMYTEYPGLIKGIEWNDESETRLRVALSSAPTMGKNEIYYPALYEYLYIPIEEALKSMEITLNPWDDNCFKEQVQKILQANDVTRNCKIKESTMRNQVRR